MTAPGPAPASQPLPITRNQPAPGAGSESSGPTAPVQPALMLRVWLGIGWQSLGGGAMTLALIQRAVVDEYRWMSGAEFTRDWAICQVVPGINLLALTILIGKRLAGARGIALALLGLLAPSVSITVAMTAVYAHIEHFRVVQAALRGIIPATVGLGLATARGLAQPLLAEDRSAGTAPLVWSVVLMILSGAAVAAAQAPIPLVLIASGGAGALLYWRRSRKLSSTGPGA